MQCVKCHGELRRKLIGQIEVDQCCQCSGIWFDLGELEDVLSAEEVDALRSFDGTNEREDATPGICPRCKGEGHLVPVHDVEHGIHIDTCPVCYGKWLDAGELDALLENGMLEDLRVFLRSLANSARG